MMDSARLSKSVYCIRRVNASGVVTLLAGSPHQEQGYVNGAGSAAGFFASRGLTLDEDDIVLVCDSGNNFIHTVTESRVVTTVAGYSGARWRTQT